MKAELAVIGGTGLHAMIEEGDEWDSNTSYGKPSGVIMVGKVGGRNVAFLSRHGKSHTIPPHKVPYVANILALSQIGVKRVIATAAVGSLRADYKPGDIVFFDQFVNMTHGRVDTFFDGPEVVHQGMADPYCSGMRGMLIKEAKALGMRYHETGTVVVINGPRFSTRAESRFFAHQGFDTISMTPYPEIALAREKGMCYAGIGLVTDYDVGMEGDTSVKPVTFDEVQKVFGKNVEVVKNLINATVPKILDHPPQCSCRLASD
jgi:5'-methylthioadenosine phosphorylase